MAGWRIQKREETKGERMKSEEEQSKGEKAEGIQGQKEEEEDREAQKMQWRRCDCDAKSPVNLSPPAMATQRCHPHHHLSTAAGGVSELKDRKLE